MEGDLCTVKDVKSKAGIALTDTSRDADIRRLISAASNFVKGELGSPVVETPCDAFYDGPGGSLLVLRVRPVLRIRRVWIDGQEVAKSTDVNIPGWYKDGSGLGVRLRGLRFTPGVGNVRVQHDAGWETVPADFREVTSQICAFRLKEEKRLGVISQANEGASITFDVSTLPRSVRDFLSNPEVVPV